MSADTPAEKVKRPASQYYWGDWWKDKGLHSCSLTARGLWHEMNCLMHEGEPYGHLTLNGKPMTVPQLANQCRITIAACRKLLDELLAAGVPSTDPASGALFSRRMVRDERIREARAAGGKAGAEHGFKGAESGAKGGRPKKAKGGAEGGFSTPHDVVGKPPPSSSSSSSTSASSDEEASFATHPPAAGEPPPGDYDPIELAAMEAAAMDQLGTPPPAKPATAKRPARELPEEQDAPTNAIWRAYASTYREVYDVEPVRNAKVNGQLAQLLQRLGRDDAPKVAGWYVRQTEAFLRAKHHPIDLLLRDCEGLRTRWKRWEAGHAELATHGHGHGPPPTTTISAAGHQTLLNAEAARRRLFPKSNGEPE